MPKVSAATPELMQQLPAMDKPARTTHKESNTGCRAFRATQKFVICTTASASTGTH
eukprot:CAMPEP_0176127044 /NCGR_PEP_ID=MMETSP0120_2-20121206/64140_1 /TAXON_ID=160619 /ORGANISM="Kryptoperidinium foliaceum, Strain CCMP 1326" /LENGTH=55 /DNA_ID=CAMNT_0017462013 /DNA_START=172 /DNA_END=336 /DNA_ORIENTATION=-